jgi:hypothetical protein
MPAYAAGGLSRSFFSISPILRSMASIRNFTD